MVQALRSERYIVVKVAIVGRTYFFFPLFLCAYRRFAQRVELFHRNHLCSTNGRQYVIPSEAFTDLRVTSSGSNYLPYLIRTKLRSARNYCLGPAVSNVKTVGFGVAPDHMINDWFREPKQCDGPDLRCCQTPHPMLCALGEDRNVQYVIKDVKVLAKPRKFCAIWGWQDRNNSLALEMPQEKMNVWTVRAAFSPGRPARHHDAFTIASRCMRTTLTLDDDIAARLQAESRKTGRPFKIVVNEYLRAGLAQRRAAHKAAPFRVEPVRMGALLPGRSYDNIGALLEDAEGHEHR